MDDCGHVGYQSRFRFVFSFSFILVFEFNVINVILVNNGLVLATKHRAPISRIKETRAWSWVRFTVSIDAAQMESEILLNRYPTS